MAFIGSLWTEFQNEPETMFPMDFLRTNTKLLYLWPFDHEVYSSYILLVSDKAAQGHRNSKGMCAFVEQILPACWNRLKLNFFFFVHLTSVYSLLFFVFRYCFWIVKAFVHAHHRLELPHPNHFDSASCEFSFFLREFDVYARKLINNSHSWRHSWHSSILVIFVMYFSAKHECTTIFGHYTLFLSLSLQRSGFARYNHLTLFYFICKHNECLSISMSCD